VTILSIPCRFFFYVMEIYKDRKCAHVLSLNYISWVNVSSTANVISLSSSNYMCNAGHGLSFTAMVPDKVTVSILLLWAPLSYLCAEFTQKAIRASSKNSPLWQRRFARSASSLEYPIYPVKSHISRVELGNHGAKFMSKIRAEYLLWLLCSGTKEIAVSRLLPS
jgi:hypothetical protein